MVMKENLNFSSHLWYLPQRQLFSAILLLFWGSRLKTICCMREELLFLNVVCCSCCSVLSVRSEDFYDGTVGTRGPS